MTRFPIDAPKARVIKTLKMLGFRLIREKEHISRLRINPEDSKTPLTMPNHSFIKGSTLKTICNQAGILRKDFLDAYSKT